MRFPSIWEAYFQKKKSLVKKSLVIEKGGGASGASPPGSEPDIEKRTKCANKTFIDTHVMSQTALPTAVAENARFSKFELELNS